MDVLKVFLLEDRVWAWNGKCV